MITFKPQEIKDIEDFIDLEEKSFERHKVANLSYLIDICMQEGYGKSTDITDSEYAILKGWCDIMRMEDKYLDAFINYFKKKRSLHRNNNLKQKNFFKNIEAKEFVDKSMEYILKEHRFDKDAMVIGISKKNLNKLWKIAYNNLRIDPEESDLLGYIIRMNEIIVPIERAKEKSKKYLERYNKNKSILICLADSDLQKNEIIDHLIELGYDISMINYKATEYEVLSLDVLDKDQGKTQYNFEYDITRIKGETSPNIIIIDPKAIEEKTKMATNGEISNYIDNELYKVNKSFEKRNIEIPILIYGPKDLIKRVNINNGFIGVLERNDYNDFPELDKLQSAINTLYAGIEDYRQ